MVGLWCRQTSSESPCSTGSPISELSPKFRSLPEVERAVGEQEQGRRSPDPLNCSPLQFPLNPRAASARTYSISRLRFPCSFPRTRSTDAAFRGEAQLGCCMHVDACTWMSDG